MYVLGSGTHVMVDRLFVFRLAPVARCLLGDDVVLKNCQLFNKTPGKSQATPAHQDGFYFMIMPQAAVTLWLALDDANVDNGCVWYVAGSHHFGLRDHTFSNILGFSQQCVDFGQRELDKNMSAMEAKPGDLLGHHSLTIHGAYANTTKDKPRRALGAIFYRHDVLIDEDRHREYQTRLAHQWKEAEKI